MLVPFWNQEPAAGVTVFGTRGSDSGHCFSPSRSLGNSEHLENPPGLIGDLKFVAVHFPLDADQKIEMHTFGFQPGFQIFAGIGAEFDEHFSFEHVDEYAFGMSEPSGLHALGESFGSLAREASECVLREVAWHRNSCVRIGV